MSHFSSPFQGLSPKLPALPVVADLNDVDACMAAAKKNQPFVCVFRHGENTDNTDRWSNRNRAIFETQFIPNIRELHCHTNGLPSTLAKEANIRFLKPDRIVMHADYSHDKPDLLMYQALPFRSMFEKLKENKWEGVLEFSKPLPPPPLITQLWQKSDFPLPFSIRSTDGSLNIPAGTVPDPAAPESEEKAVMHMQEELNKEGIDVQKTDEGFTVSPRHEIWGIEDSSAITNPQHFRFSLVIPGQYLGKDEESGFGMQYNFSNGAGIAFKDNGARVRIATKTTNGKLHLLDFRRKK